MNEFLSGHIGRCLGATLPTAPTAPTTLTTTSTTKPKLTAEQILQYGQQVAEIYNTVKNPSSGSQAPIVMIDPNAQKPAPDYTKIALIGVGGLVVVGALVWALKGGKKKGLGCPDKPEATSMLNGTKKKSRKRKK